MASPAPHSSRATSGAAPGFDPSWAVCALGLAVWYAPWEPALPVLSLDPSWRLGLALACEEGLQFGRDIVFTYGPYGCLATWQYWPSTYWPSIVYWGALALGAAVLARPAGQAPARPILAWTGLFLLGFFPDTALMALPAAYVLGARDGRSTALQRVVAWVGLAAIALTKFSLAPLALLALLAGALLAAGSVARRLATDLLGFALAVAVLWLARGQALAGLGDYLLQSLEIARGYPLAMALPASAAVCTALVVSDLALVAAAWADGAGLSRGRRAVWTLWVAALLFLSLRHAATRGDAVHLIWGASFLAGYACLSLAHRPAPGPRMGLQAAATAGVLGMAALLHLGRPPVGASLYAGLYERATGALGVFTGFARADLPGPPADTLRQLAAKAKTQLPLRTAVHGTVDVIAYDQFLLLGLDDAHWAPRPVFQSYSAYTPRLAALNADHLASERAPQWLIVAVQSIDERLPVLDDAALWGLLLRRYDAVERQGEHLLMRRRPTPPAAATSTSRTLGAFSDWAPLPATPPGTQLTARVQVEPSTLQALRAALWKPPRVWIELEREGSAATRRYRFLPEIGAAGVLLAPMIENLDDLVAATGAPDAPRDRMTAPGRVTALRLVDGRGRPLRFTLSIDLTATP